MDKNNFLHWEQMFINETFETDTSFLLKKGTIPFLISAPHSTTHFRNGVNKLGEYRTGVLAEILHQETGCHVIYKTKHNFDDPNYDEFTPYKMALREHILTYQIPILIDLHIMNPSREHMIDIGTGRGKNVIHHKQIGQMIQSQFSNSNIHRVELDHVFSASFPHTISSFISKECKVDCLQLEVNWSMYDFEKNEDLFHSFYQTLKSFILNYSSHF